MGRSDHAQRQSALKDREEVQIRSELHAGDIGAVLYLHGVCYGQEYNWDHTFESYIATTLAEFTRSFDPQSDCLWVAETSERIIGSIGIMGRTEAQAQLRWFLVHPDYRGQGIGRELLSQALSFCRDRQFHSIFLRTASPLTVAAHLYKSMGFQVIDQKTHEVWGHMLTEYRYELDLISAHQLGTPRGRTKGEERLVGKRGPSKSGQSPVHPIPVTPNPRPSATPYPAIAS